MTQKLMIALAAGLTGLPALAALPLGLKCDASIKIVAAEVGQIGTYEVQKGMQKEKHSALVNRKKIAPVHTCAFEQDVAPGNVVVVRYTGPEVQDTEVQCIDLANNNAPVVFPKSIYTVRVPNLAPYMLMPYCPDGVATDGAVCSKLGSQSERGSEYRDTVMKWKANDPKTKQYKIDLQFDPAHVSRAPPYAPSVPYGAKLFCAAINKKGEVVVAATAPYPASNTDTPAQTAGTASSPAASALERLGRVRRP